MSTIDNRIVEMSFDNKKFEKGIAKSQKSLKDFNKALGNINSIVTKEYVDKAISTAVGAAMEASY